LETSPVTDPDQSRKFFSPSLSHSFLKLSRCEHKLNKNLIIKISCLFFMLH
jgi:hypothetical protein